ncbi:MAG: superoxide dismutase family protein [Desulfobaccales bacterium]
MRSRVLVAAMALATVLIWGCGESKEPAAKAPAAKALAAKATLVDAKGQKVGEASLTETPQGVKIDLTVENLPPGVHAFHIHDKMLCESPDFMSAGGHFNPYHKQHGLKNPQGPHAGDLPSITVGPDGRATVSVVANLVTLKDGEINSLFQPGGTSLMIHANPDDEVSDPAGNAGPRIACGAITRQ